MRWLGKPSGGRGRRIHEDGMEILPSSLSMDVGQENRNGVRERGQAGRPERSKPVAIRQPCPARDSGSSLCPVGQGFLFLTGTTGGCGRIAEQRFQTVQPVNTVNDRSPACKPV
jgi:hypothetical protein